MLAGSAHVLTLVRCHWLYYPKAPAKTVMTRPVMPLDVSEAKKAAAEAVLATEIGRLSGGSDIGGISPKMRICPATFS